jgi:hypothetical protein
MKNMDWLFNENITNWKKYNIDSHFKLAIQILFTIYNFTSIWD